MRITTLTTILATTLAGCTGMGMMTGEAAMHDAIDDADAENQRHLTVGRRAGTLAALLDDVPVHASAVDTILDRMHGPMAAMQHCTGIDAMMDARDGMHGEVDSHTATMDAAAELGEARIEIERHGGAMSGMLADMTMMLDGMDCGTW